MCGVYYSIMHTMHPNLVCLLCVPSLYSTLSFENFSISLSPHFVCSVMIVGFNFDSYTKCVLIVYKALCAVFYYKNMHLPIVLCCAMKIHCLYIYQQNFITTIYRL